MPKSFLFLNLSSPEITIHKKTSLWKTVQIMLSEVNETTVCR